MNRQEQEKTQARITDLQRYAVELSAFVAKNEASGASLTNQWAELAQIEEKNLTTLKGLR